MHPRYLRLRPGADPRAAVTKLNQLVNDGRNVIATVAGRIGEGPDALPLATAYVRWVEEVETRLLALTVDVDLIEALLTERYWRIRQLHEEPVLPTQLVRTEITQQTQWLEALRDELQKRLNRIDAAPGTPTVIDTNVLLEFLPPAQVNWAAVTNKQMIRLIVPLRVVEELDAAKYDARRRDRADRARRVLPQLEAAIGEAGAPRQLRPETTLEVLVEPSPRYRPVDADEEVLQTCRELQQFGTQRTILVTADVCMRLRAQALGLNTVPMPDEYSRNTSAS